MIHCIQCLHTYIFMNQNAVRSLSLQDPAMLLRKKDDDRRLLLPARPQPPPSPPPCERGAKKALRGRGENQTGWRGTTGIVYTIDTNISMVYTHTFPPSLRPALGSRRRRVVVNLSRDRAGWETRSSSVAQAFEGLLGVTTCIHGRKQHYTRPAN